MGFGAACRFALVFVGLHVAGAASAAEAGKATFENQLVAVRDVYGAAGQPAGITTGRDAVIIDLEKAQALFVPRYTAGTIPSAKAVVVELKPDGPGTPLANTSTYPDAFPRPNIKQILETARVTVWDYTWTPGVPPPTHFHTMPALPVFLADGALRIQAAKEARYDPNFTIIARSDAMSLFEKKDDLNELIRRGKM